MNNNPLIMAADQIARKVAKYKIRARHYYFDIILSVHRCPKCGGRVRSIGRSRCACGCGYVFDPTLSFQRSSCCGQSLVRKTMHYVCSGCYRTIPSMFLFDEKLFDRIYFRQMVRDSRARAGKRREEMKRTVLRSSSGELRLTEEPRLELIPGIIEDLNRFIGSEESEPESCFHAPDSVFNMEAYRSHLLRILGDDCLMFSEIKPFMDDLRMDKIRRFMTLVFMENDREVVLTPYGSDLLVERDSDEAYS